MKAGRKAFLIKAVLYSMMGEKRKTERAEASWGKDIIFIPPLLLTIFLGATEIGWTESRAAFLIPKSGLEKVFEL